MYTDIHQFEPLLPADARMEPLLAKAHDLSRLATTLAGTRVPPELRSLLRNMNSYYTNRIEGQHTRPHEIDQALRQDFSKDATLAAKQRLAIAHIEAEQTLEQRYTGPEGAAQLYAPEALQDIHRTLFARLPAADLFTSDSISKSFVSRREAADSAVARQGEATTTRMIWKWNEQEPIALGALRQRNVSVGQHVAPAHAAVPLFLQRWSAFYGGVRRGEAALVALACAHQRLGWVHPFVDGNGRVMRLHTHTWLRAQGYTGGLWSPLRGFARSTERYYALLADADSLRRGDLDGRGNLSEQALIAWATYVLDTCLDQVRFMAGLLDFEAIKNRIEACLAYEATLRKHGVRQ